MALQSVASKGLNTAAFAAIHNIRPVSDTEDVADRFLDMGGGVQEISNTPRAHQLWGSVPLEPTGRGHVILLAVELAVALELMRFTQK